MHASHGRRAGLQHTTTRTTNNPDRHNTISIAPPPGALSAQVVQSCDQNATQQCCATQTSLWPEPHCCSAWPTVITSRSRSMQRSAAAAAAAAAGLQPQLLAAAAACCTAATGTAAGRACGSLLVRACAGAVQAVAARIAGGVGVVSHHVHKLQGKQQAGTAQAAGRQHMRHVRSGGQHSQPPASAPACSAQEAQRSHGWHYAGVTQHSISRNSLPHLLIVHLAVVCVADAAADLAHHVLGLSVRCMRGAAGRAEAGRARPSPRPPLAGLRPLSGPRQLVCDSSIRACEHQHTNTLCVQHVC